MKVHEICIPDKYYLELVEIAERRFLRLWFDDSGGGSGGCSGCTGDGNGGGVMARLIIQPICINNKANCFSPLPPRKHKENFSTVRNLANSFACRSNETFRRLLILRYPKRVSFISVAASIPPFTDFALI